jgi:hypothetical protein
MKHEHRKYYNGSPTLLRLEQDKREALVNLCGQCTESQQAFFKKIFQSTDKSIRQIVDDMPYDKLDTTIQLCESTIKGNYKKQINLFFNVLSDTK